MAIVFEKVTEESKFLSSADIVETQIIEYRIDPLTKKSTFLSSTAINAHLKKAIALNEEEIQEIIRKSPAGCFMCPEQVKSSTPQYMKEIIPEVTLIVGKARVFPNTLSLAKYSAVVTIPEQHFWWLDECAPSILVDYISCALEFIKRVYHSDPGAEHAAIGCNYLFPAGSSVVHPHFHVLMGGFPFDYISGLLVKSKQYFDRNSVNYWSELIESEQEKGERYVGRVGNVEWLTPFAPMGNKEIQALVREKSNLLELNNEDINNLAKGLSKVLTYYHNQGEYSFNMVIYSGPLGAKLDHFWCGLRVATRVVLPPYHTSDITWRQRLLLRQEEWFDMPEMVAKELRPMFEGEP